MDRGTRERLAQEYAALDATARARIGTQLATGDARQRVRRAHRRLLVLGVLLLFAAAGVVGGWYAVVAQRSLARLRNQVEHQRAQERAEAGDDVPAPR